VLRAASTAVRALVVAAALSTSACGLVGGADRDGGTGASESGGASAGGSEVATSGDERVVGAVDASVQDRHPQGHLLSASSVEVRERSIAVEVSLVNGSTDDISIGNHRLWLVDDVGGTYEFSPPRPRTRTSRSAPAPSSPARSSSWEFWTRRPRP